jgi:hypothetical protein
MLLPALARARSQAKRVNCMSNLKQLLLAEIMYTSDSSGYSFPVYTETTGYAGGNSLWMGSLITYDARSDKVRMCPCAGTNRLDVDTGAGACDTAWNWETSPSYIVGSYAFNGWMYSGDSSQIGEYRTDVPISVAMGYVFNKESSIQKPAQTPVLTDQVWVDFWPMEQDTPSTDLYHANGTANPPTIARCVTPRHGWSNPSAAPRSRPISQALPGGIDVATADGHVEYTPLELLWQFYWHLNWVVPSKRPGT